MHPLLLANHLIMLAGGSIDGNKRPLDNSERWGVTLAGLGIVIAALALLVVIIFLFGKIFDVINANQKAKEAKIAEQKKPKNTPAPIKKAPPAPTPVVTKQEDDEEVIAVISAVVAMMSEQDGKIYKVKSVKAVSKNNGFSGRSAWAMDGRRQNVSPF
ncbi:MAG: OadG family protein [Oscillospiraceae bacterium]|nr:OadG family protein [Oscillospiraceae bacterium]